MSKLDLLSVSEIAIAASQGWMVCEVFDGKEFRHSILPLKFEPPMRNADEARRRVAALALNGNVLASKAIALCAHSALVVGAKKVRPKRKA